MLLDVVIENERQRPPSQQELADWADRFGMTFPVLSDRDGIMWDYAGNGSVGLPFKVLLDDGAEILSTNPRDRDIAPTLGD